MQQDPMLPDEQGIPAESLAEIESLWGEALSRTVDVGETIKPADAGKPTESHASIHSYTIDWAERHVQPAPQFELLEKLGEGGMGLVYRARQNSIDRKIAVKIIKARAVEGADQRSAFLSEAIVTGDLDHPNIVPIYELGAGGGGELFYAMKEVKGTSWRDTLEKNSREENLEILLRVSDAVAFAHAKGVIHRDLKPDNVMLGEFGEVLVMDWGLSVSFSGEGKAEPLTESTLRGGTPAYMSPEMASADSGPMGPWSDIYLLGGILYEIVTGMRPHQGNNVYSSVYQAMQNRIQEPAESGELVEIALKAMATAPEDRFDSVKLFQQAIRDHEAHVESIKICDKARADLEEADRAQDYDAFAQAVFGFKQALKMWGDNAEAKKTLRHAQLAYAECALEKGDLDLAASQLDEKVRKHKALARAVDAAQNRRVAKQKRLKLLTGLSVASGIIIVVGALAAALMIRAEQKETKDALELVKAERDNVRMEKQETQKALARIEEEQKRTAIEKERAQQEARRARGVSDFLTSMLSKADPRGRGGRSVTVLSVIDAMSDELEKQFGKDAATRQSLEGAIGGVYFGLGQYDKALRHLRRAEELAKELYGGDHPRYASSLNVLALLYRSRGENARAESLFHKTLKIRKKSVGEGHHDYAASLNNLAGLYKDQGKYAEAEPLYRETIAVAKKVLGKDHPDTARSLNNLAEVYRARGLYAKAEPLYRESIAILKKVYGEKHPHYAMSMHNLAELLLTQGANARAKPLYHEASMILKHALGEDHPDYATSLHSLAGLYSAQGDHAKAESLCRKTMAIWKKSLGEDHPTYATGLSRLGELLFSQGRVGEAEPLLMQAIDIYTKKLGKTHTRTKTAAEALRRVRQKLKKKK